MLSDKRPHLIAVYETILKIECDDFDLKYKSGSLKMCHKSANIMDIILKIKNVYVI